MTEILISTEPAGPPLTASPVEFLVAEFGPAMFRVAVSIVSDRALAEDVLQESLLKAWQHFDEYRGDAPVRSWVLRITHNTAISMLRRRREELRSPEAFANEVRDGSTDVERTVSGRAALEGIWLALDQLDPTTRTIIVLREVEQMSYDEIGDVLSLPLPTVKTRLFRGRQKLAELLKEWR